MSKSAPKAPDYAAAAQQQAQGSKEVTEQQTWANRADQFTPWGSQTWQNQQVWDPSTQQYLNRWAQTTQLAPDAQAALESQMRLQRDRSQLGESLTDRMRNEFGTPMDFGNLPAAGQNVQAPGQVQGGPIQSSIPTEQLQRGYDIKGPELDPSQRYQQQAQDAIYNQWASRALPQQERQEEALRTRMTNQGIPEGSEAWNREMEQMRQANADAMQQAQYQATIGSGAEAQRYLGMDAATRAQLTGEQKDLAGFGNQAALGQFGMMSGAGQFANQAQQQAFGQQSQQAQQQFQNQMQQSQYQNQLRQQQLAEEMQKRGWSLNEINALMSGQQVGMPSMPSYNTASRAEGPQSLAAAQMQGQADLDRFNAQQAAMQGMMSGIGSLGSAFMPM